MLAGLGAGEPIYLADAALMDSVVGFRIHRGVLAIGAGNYGGKLGKFHFHLHKLLADS